MRVVGFLSALASLAGLSGPAWAQDIVRPAEFTLLRPQEPSPAPMIMAPINVQPLAQKQWSWQSNNPQAIVMQPLKPQPQVPQGNHWHGDQFNTWQFQSHNWNTRDYAPSRIPAEDSALHRQSLNW